MGHHHHRRGGGRTKPVKSADDPPLTASPTWSSSSSDMAGQSSLRKGQQQPTMVDLSTTTTTKATAPSTTTKLSTTPASTIRAKMEDILVLAIVFCGFALLSVCVGIAAGISISVHYFESTTATAAAAAASSLDPNHSATRMIILLLIYGSITTTTTTKTKDDTHSMQQLLQGLRRTSASTTLPDLLTMDELVTSYEVHPHPLTGRPMLLPLVWQPPPPLWERPRTAPSLAVPPAPCPNDPSIVGYSSWTSLHTALRYLPTTAAATDSQWQEPPHQWDDSQYYEPITTLTVCPGTTLRGRAPLPLATPALHLVCGGKDCTLDGPLQIASHDIVLRGVTLTEALKMAVDRDHSVRVEDATFRSSDLLALAQETVRDSHHDSRVELYRCYSVPARSSRWRWWFR